MDPLKAIRMCWTAMWSGSSADFAIPFMAGTPTIKKQRKALNSREDLFILISFFVSFLRVVPLFPGEGRRF
jgi:hypothetical protein